jgi:hypothetical protein
MSEEQQSSARNPEQSMESLNWFAYGLLGFLGGFLIVPVLLRFIANSFFVLVPACAICLSAGFFAKGHASRAMFKGFWRGVLLSTILCGLAILRNRQIQEITHHAT